MEIISFAPLDSMIDDLWAEGYRQGYQAGLAARYGYEKHMLEGIIIDLQNMLENDPREEENKNGLVMNGAEDAPLQEKG